jgi:hypothetical protein
MKSKPAPERDTPATPADEERRVVEEIDTYIAQVAEQIPKDPKPKRDGQRLK